MPYPTDLEEAMYDALQTILRSLLRKLVTKTEYVAMINVAVKAIKLYEDKKYGSKRSLQ